MGFKPNRKFKRKYNRIFKRDPQAANLFLLLCEMSNKRGKVIIQDESQLAELMALRFEDTKKYAL